MSSMQYFHLLSVSIASAYLRLTWRQYQPKTNKKKKNSNNKKSHAGGWTYASKKGMAIKDIYSKEIDVFLQWVGKEIVWVIS